MNLSKTKPRTLGGVVVGVLFLLTLSFGIVSAANTNSIDLESGSSQHLSISDGSQTGLDLSGDLTFEMWVKPESLAFSGLITKWGGGGTEAYRFSTDGSGNIMLRVNDGSNERVYEWSSVLSTGSWQHVAVALDISADTANLYKDGSDQGAATKAGSVASSIANTSATFEIGRDSQAGTGYFDGLIDDVRIWNIVRTSTEINDDKARELNGNETGLVSYWKLNSSLSDTTTTGNTLTNNNSATGSSDVAFGAFTEDLVVRKSTNESVTSSTVLQNDDELKLSLGASKTYVIDGVLFATSTSATPDIIIAFFGQTDSDIRIGYTNDVNEMVIFSGDDSNRINLPANTPTSIHVKGTVTTGSATGDFQLKWSQATSNGNPTTVMEGSYLRAEEI
jgi:hypothetical protein